MGKKIALLALITFSHKAVSFVDRYLPYQRQCKYPKSLSGMFFLSIPKDLNYIGSVTRWTFTGRHIEENFRSFPKYIDVLPKPSFSVIIRIKPVDLQL
jgi:hypothetical protein